MIRPINTGFNVATALKPWKTRPGRRIRVHLLLRFNVATALKPWKTEHFDDFEAHLLAASMWPRR